MARPPAQVNAIADALVRQIREDFTDHPELWAEVPQTLERGLRLNADSLPAPAVFVISALDQPIKDIEDGGRSGMHLSNFPLAVFMHVAGAVDESAIEDLAADVRRAIATDVQLGAVLVAGRIIFGDCPRAFDMSETGGHGWARQDLTVEYQWDETNP